MYLCISSTENHKGKRHTMIDRWNDVERKINVLQSLWSQGLDNLARETMHKQMKN